MREQGLASQVEEATSEELRCAWVQEQVWAWVLEQGPELWPLLVSVLALEQELVLVLESLSA